MLEECLGYIRGFFCRFVLLSSRDTVLLSWFDLSQLAGSIPTPSLLIYKKWVDSVEDQISDGFWRSLLSREQS